MRKKPANHVIGNAFLVVAVIAVIAIAVLNRNEVSMYDVGIFVLINIVVTSLLGFSILTEKQKSL